MSLLQNFILFNVLFLFIVSACHTKRNKNYNKEREKTCNFKNVSVPVYNFQSNEIALNSNFPTIYFFNASKPNIAILQCHESNVNYLSQNITAEYKNNNSDFTNSPVECMTVCQATKNVNTSLSTLEQINVGCLLRYPSPKHLNMDIFLDQNIVKHNILR